MIHRSTDPSMDGAAFDAVSESADGLIEFVDGSADPIGTSLLRTRKW